MAVVLLGQPTQPTTTPAGAQLSGRLRITTVRWMVTVPPVTWIPPPLTAEHVCFAIHSIALGTHLNLSSYGSPVDATKLGPPESLVRDNVQVLLDGFGWRPLATEWDYGRTYRRLIETVFADERRRLEAG